MSETPTADTIAARRRADTIEFFAMIFAALGAGAHWGFGAMLMVGGSITAVCIAIGKLRVSTT